MAKLVTRTQYIENTEDILDFTVTKLQEYAGWKVRKFPGTGYTKLFKYMPELRLPAAVICCNSSTFSKQSIPARTLHMEIIVAVEFYAEDNNIELRTLMHKVITLLDGEIFNKKVRFDIASHDSIDFGPNIVAYLIRFDVVNY